MSASEPFILIVEDNPDMQDVMVQIFDLSGIRARSVSRGDAALRVIREQFPRLVLLDIDLLGNMSGLDVLHTIREDPQLAKTRVILMTAHQSAVRSDAAQSADLILLKPVEVEQLLNHVQRLMDL